MNRWMHKGLAGLLVSCSVLTAGWLAPPAAHAADSQAVKVQVNDQLIAFPDAQPFLDQNQSTQVPVRFVTERLGYTLDWSKVGQQVQVTLKNDRHTIVLTSGNATAMIDNEPVTMATSAEFKNGRVFVPLRFISEAADVQVHWESASRLALVSSDGKQHTPDYEVFEATAYSADPAENGGYAAYDYMGNPLALGTIAVDPNVIPLGSKLYIEGYHFAGLPVGGMYAYATDIGGAVKGNHLDIYIPGSAASLRSFGVQKVKVYRITE